MNSEVDIYENCDPKAMNAEFYRTIKIINDAIKQEKEYKKRIDELEEGIQDLIRFAEMPIIERSGQYTNAVKVISEGLQELLNKDKEQ